MAKSARLWHKRCKGFARADRRKVGLKPREATLRFQRLDLNLLVALDALLTERSVSLAADRIYLSQSATSSALGRLREYFDDELLVLKGRQMVLTARAEELIEPVRAVLQQIRSTIAVPPPFDPATSDRMISIMASDFTTEVLLSKAMLDFAETAPNMRFEISPLNDSLIETLERGGADLLITIDYAISSDHPSCVLFDDDYVVVGWADNPLLQQQMDKDLYFDLGHISVRFGKSRVPAFDEWFMQSNAMQRRVEIIAPSFVSVPGMLVGSRRIATMHRRLAQRVAQHLPLKIMPVPFDIPVIREVAQWHASSASDRAICWVVERLKAIAAEAAPDPQMGDRANRPDLAKHFMATTGGHARHY